MRHYVSSFGGHIRFGAMSTKKLLYIYIYISGQFPTAQMRGPMVIKFGIWTFSGYIAGQFFHSSR